MSTIRDIIHSIWLCWQLAIAAFFLGAQLFYIVGPLVIGAFVTLFGFAVIARYLVWPAVRFAGTTTYRLGAWVAKTVNTREATRRQVVSAHFAHPTA